MAQLDTLSRFSSATQTAAPNVYRLPTGISNAYFVALDADDYVLVDVGDSNHTQKIIDAAGELFAALPPRAIILTHAHFDHAGGLPGLLKIWPHVPAYAHPLELPYVNDGRRYPPGDPTVGGAGAQMSRFMDTARATPGGMVEPLPEEVVMLEMMPGWELHPTPGHTPGHVSLWNESTRTLIAGDAVVTLNQNSALAFLAQTPVISQPPPYATYNWHQARQSAHSLAELEPFYLCTGHGVPMRGGQVAGALKAFVKHFPTPKRGRYVKSPARFNREGPVFIPPAGPDYVKYAAIGAGVVGLGTAAYLVTRSLRNKCRDGVLNS